MAQDTTVTIPLDAITVGERRRVDYGDIAGLADSIRENGLLHFPVVDAAYNLVAGGRRLRAVAALGWHEVPVHVLDGDMSKRRLRIIELTENLSRKDLTPYEASRGIVDLADELAEADREAAAAHGFTLTPATETEPESDSDQPSTETCFNLKQVSGKRGPDQTPGSIRRVAEQMERAPSEITKARQHVAAVEAHPELRNEPQSTAITYAKAIEAQPELKGQPIPVVADDYRAKRNAMRAEREAHAAREAEIEAQQQRMLVAADPKGLLARNELRDTYRRHLAAVESLIAMKPAALIPALNDADRTHIEAFVSFIRDWCDGVDAVLAPGPRSMRG